MHYRERQINFQGKTAAFEGFGPETNPHKPKTNFHRYWAAGHASVPQSPTPVGYTYSIGEIVKPRGINMCRLEKRSIIADIIDVPSDQIAFNPHIDEGDNDTGVGHHQWLVFEGKGNPVSGCLVEIDRSDFSKIPVDLQLHRPLSVNEEGHIVSENTEFDQSFFKDIQFDADDVDEEEIIAAAQGERDAWRDIESRSLPSQSEA